MISIVVDVLVQLRLSVDEQVRGILPRRASPEPKINATNVVVFMKWSAKVSPSHGHRVWRPQPAASPVADNSPLRSSGFLIHGAWRCQVRVRRVGRACRAN